MTSPYYADRWSVLLAADRQAARDRGTLPEPAAPIIPPGIDIPCKIHFVGPCQLLGELFDYGDDFLIEESMLPGLTDRLGHVAVLEMLLDPEAQRRRWGSYRIRRGPWPAGVDKVAPGSARWEAARRDQYAWARSRPFESQRDEALTECRARFGPSEFGACPASIARRAYGAEAPA